MQWNRRLALLALLCLPACSGPRGTGQSFPNSPPQKNAPKATATPSATTNNGAIVTPGNLRLGRISLVNASARYVIITYPVGQLPARDSRLSAFRNGLKVADLKVTDFSRDINTVADILAGECQVGDSVREN